MPRIYPGMFRGLSVRSKQSSKELGEIARMTETCLFSDRLGCDSLSVSAVLVQRLWPVQMSTLKCWSGFSSAEIPFCILSRRARERQGRVQLGNSGWTRTGCILVHCTSLLHPPVLPFSTSCLQRCSLSKEILQLNLPFPTFTRRQYHFHREIRVDFLPRFACFSS